VGRDVLINTSRVPSWRDLSGRARWSLVLNNGIVTVATAVVILAVGIPCLVSGWLFPELLGTLAVLTAAGVAAYGLYLIGRRVVRGRPALRYVVTTDGFESTFGDQASEHRFDEFVRAEPTERGWLLHREKGRPWLMVKVAFGPREDQQLRQVLAEHGLLDGWAGGEPASAGPAAGPADPAAGSARAEAGEGEELGPGAGVVA
jgi:hypothetical protein